MFQTINALAHALPHHTWGEWTPAHTVVLLLSFGVWCALAVASHAASSVLFATYASLEAPMRREWVSRCVSSCHAVWQVAGFVSIRLMAERMDFAEYPPISDFYFLSLAAYLSFDLLLVASTPQLRSLGTVAHHGVGLSAVCAVTVTRIGCCFLAGFLLTELSTPFVNFHWFFRTCDEKPSLVLANGFLMWLTFVAGRILVLPYAVYLVFAHIHQVIAFSPWLAAFYVSLFVTISILNLYWASLISRGLLKAWRKPKAD